MSGPTEPWRSRALSKRAIQREQATALFRLGLRTRGIRTTRDVPLDEGARIMPRETRPRDRALAGKARRRARQGAGR